MPGPMTETERALLEEIHGLRVRVGRLERALGAALRVATEPPAEGYEPGSSPEVEAAFAALAARVRERSERKS
jgi:hypothetical protein